MKTLCISERGKIFIRRMSKTKEGIKKLFNEASSESQSVRRKNIRI